MIDLLEAELGQPYDATYPKWVIACGAKVIPALFPKLRELKSPEVTKAYGGGLCWGLMQSGQKLFIEAGRKLPSSCVAEPTPEQTQALVDSLYGKDSGFSLPPDGDDMIPLQVREEFETLMATLGLEESSLFYAGMADAFSMVAGKNKTTLATSVYTTMLLYWRLVDRLASIDQLHDFLTRVLGPNVVGSDIKRIRQHCGRIGKRYAAPGRPKNNLTCLKT